MEDDVQTRARDLRAELSAALTLVDEPQDWGIATADSRRLDEFVAFLTARDFAPTQEFDLVDLILASANDVLRGVACADLHGVEGLLDRYPDAAEVHADYWASLEDVQEFPLGVWIRRRRGSSQSVSRQDRR